MNKGNSESVNIFLSSPLQHFIDGVYCDSIESGRGIVVNPATGDKIVDIAYGTSKDVDAAVRAAEHAFTIWGAMAPSERAALIHRFADKLESEAHNIAQLESLDVGKPLAASQDGIASGIECARYFAEVAENAEYNRPLSIKNMEARINRTPYGVCGFIFPWNFPYLLFMWNIMPAIAAGNTVVVKPSEVTPVSTLYLCKIAKEAGIPDGVINVVVGDGENVGSAIVEHPVIKRMAFTGSTKVGKMVAEKCGARPIPCKLELGGKGAAVVFDDCDQEKAAKELAGAITFNTGQVCCTATRWFVHENIYESFKEKVIHNLQNLKIGPGMSDGVEMGPLVSKLQQERVLDYYQKGEADGANILLAGGKVTDGGKEGGFFVSPCLMEGDTNNICFREEVFGPTAYLIKFTDEDEVIEQVNSLQYGLANSVWSSNEERCQQVAERMVSGNSWINAHNVFAYGLPYAGVNLSGVGGGVNSADTFYDYLRDLTIAKPLG
jgi:acyl-CoA reductase-like NAD-dependent aldehyde dehydrogenase